MTKTKQNKIRKWAPLAGKWSFTELSEVYTGPEEQRDPFGLALAPGRFRQGILQMQVRLNKPLETSGRFVFGYDSSTGNYFSAGIGGYGRAYVIDEFISGRGWSGFAQEGSVSNIKPDDDLDVRLDLKGQRVRLMVNGVSVIERSLPHPLLGDQVGIFSWGPSIVTFKGFTIESALPRAFVIMQFTEPFNSFFRHVIQPITKKIGLEAFRASDVYKPGIILDDILRDILESEVIIAEITSGNPNVFYELGYAHAIGKQTILLADRASAELPFDIRGYRVIFYENTIKGKPEVERSLEEHLRNIMAGFE
jgi:hypothetical protein